MKIVKAFPPNIDDIRKHFAITEGTVFTYGDTIYSPRTDQLSEDLIAHERVHFVQQQDDIKGWWEKYMQDVQFRYLQELQAYRNQYLVFSNSHGRKERREFSRKIARDFSSKLYGNIISYQEAVKRITE